MWRVNYLLESSMRFFINLVNAFNTLYIDVKCTLPHFITGYWQDGWTEEELKQEYLKDNPWLYWDEEKADFRDVRDLD